MLAWPRVTAADVRSRTPRRTLLVTGSTRVSPERHPVGELSATDIRVTQKTKDGPARICWPSPGIVVTDLLMKDMGRRGTPQWERARRVYDIIGDRVETVTPYLAEGLLRNDRAGARVAWLTRGKASRRFLGAIIRERRLLTDADLQSS